jgi:TetR/AcrR family transcriptional repressor of mexJK operon
LGGHNISAIQTKKSAGSGAASGSDLGVTKGPGRPRDAAKEAAIIRAAQAMFMEHGFDRASVDAIAEAAGVAKATVYARFKDKEGLLRAAISSKCADFLGSTAFESASDLPMRRTLIEFAHRFLALVTDKDSLAMHALMMEAGKSRPEMPTLFFESAVLPTCRRLSGYLERQRDNGRLSFDDGEAAAWRLLGMVKSQEHMRAMLGLPRRRQKEIDAFIESCVDAFLAAHERR